jgi:hypothetical protein
VALGKAGIICVIPANFYKVDNRSSSQKHPRHLAPRYLNSMASESHGPCNLFLILTYVPGKKGEFMAGSILDSLMSMLGPNVVGPVASQLGEAPDTV